MTERRCQRCRGRLKTVRGTVVLCVRCRDCGRGGEIVRDARGEPYTRRGPAVDPTFNSNGQTPTLMTDGGRPFECPGCGQPYSLDDEPFCVCGRRRPRIDDPPVATDGGQPDQEVLGETISGPMELASELIEPNSIGTGGFRVLGSVERRLNDDELLTLKTQVRQSLQHFPELSEYTVTVGCRREPDNTDYNRWNAYASAEFVNFFIRLPTHELAPQDTVFHELGHLAIHVRDERGEDVPPSSEEFCSIFSIARMPPEWIEREEIAYLGEPTVPAAEWPRICQRALEYREEHGAGSHYIKRCREWLGIKDGDAG